MDFGRPLFLVGEYLFLMMGWGHVGILDESWIQPSGSETTTNIELGLLHDVVSHWDEYPHGILAANRTSLFPFRVTLTLSKRPAARRR